MAVMPIAARRTFRLAGVMAVSMAVAYGMATPFPFLAPLFGFMLTAAPSPPMGPRKLLGLLLAVVITLGIGLILTPVLRYYAMSGVMIIAVGLFLSTYVGVGLGKGAVSTLLTIGLTMIPAAGLVEHALARALVEALVIGIALGIACQWLVYPLFPEDAAAATPPKAPQDTDARNAAWLALRTTLIVLPPVLLALTNPSNYMATIMKAVLLGKQGSEVSARAAGRELLGSTFLAGLYSMLFWCALKILPNLWMLFLWTLLFGLYFAAKLYRVIETRFPPSFWINVAVTMLILIGPALADSTGSGVKGAFVERFALFVAVTLYAWGAILVLERLRASATFAPSPPQAPRAP